MQRDNILRWMQDVLAENKGKNNLKEAKFLATSPKKSSAILEFLLLWIFIK